MNAATIGHSRGMVLVIVLWIVTLLAVMAGGFAYSMRVETRLATSAVERAQARALAEAGVVYALAWQLDPEAQKKWPPNGDAQDWEFGGGRVRISAEDAAGRISLNNANPQLLQKILTELGVADTDAEKLSAAMADWRDPDDQTTSPGGAEDAEYRSAGRPGPKNALFDSVDELPQVLGIDRDTAQRLAGLATADTLISGINPQWASSTMLRALGLDEQAVADYVSARAQAATEGAPLPTPPSVDGVSFFSGGRSNTYHIAVAAQVGTGATVSAEAVVSTQNPPQGQVARWLSWRLR